ncbi:MAG: hypothetical protein EBU08_10690 [Micrococcales bacterium]|nr:hypothetical protein [Micrococcales bacterium]
MPRDLFDADEPKQEPIACIRCGQSIPVSTWVKRLARKTENWDTCKDCLSVNPITHIQYKHPTLGYIFCYPHQGEVDDLFRPLDEAGNLFRPGERVCGHKELDEAGNLFRPGERVCGHKDCINVKHIKSPVAPVATPTRKRRTVVDDDELFWALIEAQKYDRKKVRTK